MQVDRKVCQIKFDREVANLRRQSDILRGRGCYIIDATFPKVDLLFLPNNFLKAEFPTWIPQGDMLAIGVGQMQLKSVAGQAFGVRVDMEGYDVRAPSVTFRDPRSWELAPYDRLPQGHFRDRVGTMRPVVVEAHPKFSRPFFCMEGILEFHDHLQHTDREWFSSRSGFGLFYIAEMVLTTCCMSCQPRLLLNSPPVPSNSIWVASPNGGM
ncbi:MAG: hypothetical protein C0621_01895 [Desulfuromonas sp.]|nr:MAG: hypothetical protein C0621_01895 [Desulfuromonas sp.]